MAMVLACIRTKESACRTSSVSNVVEMLNHWAKAYPDIPLLYITDCWSYPALTSVNWTFLSPKLAGNISDIRVFNITKTKC